MLQVDIGQYTGLKLRNVNYYWIIIKESTLTGNLNYLHFSGVARYFEDVVIDCLFSRIDTKDKE